MVTPTVETPSGLLLVGLRTKEWFNRTLRTPVIRTTPRKCREATPEEDRPRMWVSATLVSRDPMDREVDRRVVREAAKAREGRQPHQRLKTPELQSPVPGRVSLTGKVFASSLDLMAASP